MSAPTGVDASPASEAEVAKYKRLAAAAAEADRDYRHADAECDNAKWWLEQCEEAMSKAIEARDAYSAEFWAKRGGEPGR